MLWCQVGEEVLVFVGSGFSCDGIWHFLSLASAGDVHKQRRRVSANEKNLQIEGSVIDEQHVEYGSQFPRTRAWISSLVIRKTISQQKVS